MDREAWIKDAMRRVSACMSLYSDYRLVVERYGASADTVPAARNAYLFAESELEAHLRTMMEGEPVAPPGYIEKLESAIAQTTRLPEQDISNDPPCDVSPVFPLGYVAAIFGHRSNGRTGWPCWRSRLLYDKKDAESVLKQWEEQFGPCFSSPNFEWVVVPLYTHPTIPEGMALVPLEPTEEMRWAAADITVAETDDRDYALGYFTAGEVYKAMIQAHQKDMCRKCGSNMKPGIATGQTFDTSDEGTCSPAGPGKIIDCMKCEACGWSVSAHQKEAGKESIESGKEGV